MTTSRDHPALHRLACLGLLALLALLLLNVPSPSHAAASYPAITETTTGPSIVGRGLQVQYTVNGSGGPAVAPNGTMVGNITFNATLSGNNVSTASIAPPTGVLVNGGVILRFTAPNLTEQVTLRIELTSSYAGVNASANFTTTIQVVAPYLLSGLIVAGPTTVTGFNMTVTVDGLSVGTVTVPTIAANGSYHFTFDYVPQGGLGAGWHTMAVSLAPEHGLVTFEGGLSQLSVRFFIVSPPPDYAIDVAVGIAAFAVAVFIWGSVVGARRRGRRAR
ncbi:MAG: hypothetical protein WA688_00285 [Thermoplasmata archaeon]